MFHYKDLARKESKKLNQMGTSKKNISVKGILHKNL